jgi:cardiolipin synthase
MSITEWAVSGAAVITVLQWLLIPRLLAQRSKSPPAILAWLWALLLFPAVGALLYILIGSERVVRRRLRLNHELKARLSAAPREQR